MNWCFCLMKSFKKDFCFILFILSGFFLLTGTIFAKADEPDYKLNVVVIDPGHGGKDPGAVGKYSKEKDIVLQVSKKLGHYIKEYMDDVDVIYTREKDVFIPLHERAEIANKNKADLFISIHANAISTSRVYGAETFAMGLHKSESNLEVAKKENAVIELEDNYEEEYEGFDPSSAESYIIFSLMQNTYLSQSLEFASYVQNQFRERVKRHDRGVKQAGFLVLWRTSMPSVLVELGFLTNPKEEKFLMSEQGQDYLASAIFRAFRSYKEDIESKSRFVKAVDREKEQTNADNDKTINKAPAFPGSDNKETDDEVIFSVQVIAAKEPISKDSEQFSGLPEVFELKSGDRYKYAVGRNSEYDEALELKETLREKFPGSFVVAHQGGNLVPLGEVLKNN